MLYLKQTPDLPTVLDAYRVPTCEELREHRKGSAATGSRWRPIHHRTMLEAFRLAASRVAPVASEVVEIDGHRMLAGVTYDLLSDGLRPSMVLRTDNMQRHAVQVGAGARVVVCGNGLMLSDWILVHRKHGPGVEAGLHELLSRAVEPWRERMQRLVWQADVLRGTPVSDRDADAITADARRAGLLTLRQAADTADTYRLYGEHGHPRFRDFGERTGWSLVNAATEIAKSVGRARSERILSGIAPFVLDTLEGQTLGLN